MNWQIVIIIERCWEIIWKIEGYIDKMKILWFYYIDNMEMQEEKIYARNL